MRSSFSNEDSNNWMSISDIMTGLMVIFLFIAVSYILQYKKNNTKLEEALKNVQDIETLQKLIDEQNSELDSVKYELSIEQDENDTIVNVLAEYQDIKHKIYHELDSLLKVANLKRSITLKKNLLIRFNDACFKARDYIIRPNLRNKLNGFIPTYFSTILKYQDKIEEIKIEGHAGTEPKRVEKVFYNTSYHRSYEVLKLLESHLQYKNNQAILEKMFSLTVYGRKRLLRHPNGDIDNNNSRRVDLRIITKSEKVLNKIEARMKK